MEQNLKGKYINIGQFINAAVNGGSIHVYTSYKALQRSLSDDVTERFPMDLAKESPILKWMLVSL